VTAHLVARLRADRGREDSWRGELVRALGRLGRPDALPTLLLDLASDGKYTPGWALEPALACGALVDPWRSRILALPRAGELARLPALDLLDAATSPNYDARIAALAQLHARRQPDELLACGLAAELDAALIKRGYARVANDWSAWRKVVSGLPKDNRERPLWIREHAPALADQRMTPMLARIRDEGADAVAATYPAARFELVADERAELDARELAVAARARA
jgi:hypothetical protein